MTKTEQVEQILRERYACQEVPNGHLTLIADEVGCTRELVRQIRNKLGMSWVSSRTVKVCASCGKEMLLSTKSATCNECSWVTLVCDQCGTSFKRSVAEIVWRAEKDHRHKGGQFCSRECADSGHTGRKPEVIGGSASLPHGLSRYNSGCRCRDCRAESAAYQRARYARRKAREASHS